MTLIGGVVRAREQRGGAGGRGDVRGAGAQELVGLVGAGRLHPLHGHRVAERGLDQLLVTDHEAERVVGGPVEGERAGAPLPLATQEAVFSPRPARRRPGPSRPRR